MTDQSKEELKPCPFCGNPGTQDFAESEDEVSCSDPECCAWPMHYFQWQQAVCWKQIETLQTRIESLGEVLKRQSEQLWKKGEAHTKEIRELVEAEWWIQRKQDKKLIGDLLYALDRIRTIDAPTFNGERVTTINPNALSRWQQIAEEAIKKAWEVLPEKATKSLE